MILELNIISYGKIQNKKIVLTNGINLIYGDNEAGKSTITSFIKAMLYGMTKRGTGIDDNDRKHFKPWDHNNFIGNLIYQDASGRKYTVSREFKGTASKDTLRVIDGDTGEEISKYSQEFGQVIFGVSHQTFESTAFIRQGSSMVLKNDELIQKMSNLISTANEDVGYESSLKSLNNLKGELRKGKSGSINILELELIVLKGKKEELEASYSECIVHMQKLDSINQEVGVVEDQQKVYELGKDYVMYQKDAQNYSRILKCRKDIDELMNSVQDIEAKIAVNGMIPTRAYLDSLLESFRTYNIEAKTISVLEERLARTQSKNDQPNNHLNIEQDYHLLLKLVNDLKIVEVQNETSQNQRKVLVDKINNVMPSECQVFNDDLEEDVKKALNNKSGAPSNRNKIVIFTMIALGLIALVVNVILGVIIIAFAVVAFLVLSRKTKDTAILEICNVKDNDELKHIYNTYLMKKQEMYTLKQMLSDLKDDVNIDYINSDIEKIFALYNCATVAELGSMLNQVQRDSILIQEMSNSFNTLTLEYEKAKIETDVAKRIFEEKASKLNMDHSNYQEYINYIASLTNSVEEYDRLVLLGTEKTKSLEALLSENDEAMLKESYTKYQAMDNVVVDANSQNNQSRLISLAGIKSELETKINNYYHSEDDINDVAWQIDAVENKLSVMQKRYDAICIAHDSIVNAMDIISRDFSPQLTKRVGEYLAILTNGKYDKLLIDKDYQIKVCDDMANSNELEYFSKGTIDQIYLAFRLALIDIVAEDNKMPIIFDDSFNNYDDKRLKNTLEVITKIAKQSQVIILSCQNREREMLASIASYNYTAI